MIVGALFAAPVAPAHAATKPGEAVAVTVSGKAEFSTNGRDWLPLRSNDTLKPGAEVRTASGATVDLFLNYNGPVVVVQSASHLVVSKLDREESGDQVVTDTQLEVKAGSILGYAQKMSSGSRYVVKNSLGDVNITGTIYQVYASGYVYVVSGAVEVRYSPRGISRLGTTVYVDAGFYFDPVAYSSTSTAPPVTDVLLTTINTTIGNVRKFNLSRGRKLTVKTVTPISL